MHHEFSFVRSSESTPLPPRIIVSGSAPATTRRVVVSLPAVWGELHRRALAHQGGDDSEWLKNFERRIIGMCNCRQQWVDDIEKCPPDFAHYFEWTVLMHNRVNFRLKKPLLSVDQARAIWAQP